MRSPHRRDHTGRILLAFLLLGPTLQVVEPPAWGQEARAAATPAGAVEPRPSHWDARDKTLWAAFLLASAMDAYQTWSVTAAESPYREANPLYGSERPELTRILAVKGLAALIAYRCLDRAEAGHRTMALKVLTGLQFGVVIANERRVEGGILIRW